MNEWGWKNRDMKYLSRRDWDMNLGPWTVALILCISLFFDLAILDLIMKFKYFINGVPIVCKYEFTNAWQFHMWLSALVGADNVHKTRWEEIK